MFYDAEEVVCSSDSTVSLYTYVYTSVYELQAEGGMLPKFMYMTSLSIPAGWLAG